MGRDISYLENLNIVLVKTTGVYNLGKESSTLKKTLNEMKRHNCQKALFDHRSATLLINPDVSSERANLYENIGFNKSAKIASVYKDVCGNIDFYEQENTLKGWQVKAFSNYEDAIKWLNDPFSSE